MKEMSEYFYLTTRIIKKATDVTFLSKTGPGLLCLTGEIILPHVNSHLP